MTIAELGAIGEFVGSVAVLITLAYLAIQVRQNTRHVQAQMGHDGWLSNVDTEIAKMGGAAAEALAKADLGDDQLTGKDLKIIDANFRAILLHIGRVEHMNSLGLEIYSIEQTAQGYIDQFNCPVGRAWWESNREIIDTVAPEIGKRLGELLTEPNSPSRKESVESFRQRLAGAHDAT
jgi:hypothetical protein